MNRNNIKYNGAGYLGLVFTVAGIIIIVVVCGLHFFGKNSHANSGIPLASAFLAFAGSLFLYSAVILQKRALEETQKNEFLKVYETFTNDYFFEIRSSAWIVLMHCMEKKDYLRFMTTNNFLVQEWRADSNNVDFVIFDLYGEKKKFHLGLDMKDKENAEEQARILLLEYHHRHRLDDYTNFLSSVALRDKGVLKQCDFGYQWWRPLLWLITDLKVIAYGSLDEANKKHNINPGKFYTTLQVLDLIYGFPSISNYSIKERMKKCILTHPLIANNATDEIKEYLNALTVSL